MPPQGPATWWRAALAIARFWASRLAIAAGSSEADGEGAGFSTADAEFSPAALAAAILLASSLASVAGSSDCGEGAVPRAISICPAAPPPSFAAISGPVWVFTCSSTVPVDSVNNASMVRDPSEVWTQSDEWSSAAVTPAGSAPLTTLSQLIVGGVAQGTPADGFAESGAELEDDGAGDDGGGVVP